MFSQAYAGPIDDARRLYRSGKYAAAIEYARKVVKRTPRDGNGNFFLGASLYKLGRFDEALAPLRQAESRGVAEASQMLTEYYMKSISTVGLRYCRKARKVSRRATITCRRSWLNSAICSGG